MDYVIDGERVALSMWRPTGAGRWESLGVEGDVWSAAAWEGNDPRSPARSAYAHHPVDGHARICEEAARVAHLAGYAHAAYLGGARRDALPIGKRTPEAIAHAEAATAALPWAAERTLRWWGDADEPREPREGRIARLVGAARLAAAVAEVEAHPPSPGDCCSPERERRAAEHAAAVGLLRRRLAAVTRWLAA